MDQKKIQFGAYVKKLLLGIGTSLLRYNAIVGTVVQLTLYDPYIMSTTLISVAQHVMYMLL